MNKTVIIGIILLITVLLGLTFVSNKQKESKAPLLEQVQQQPTSISEQTLAVDKQASFAIFTNGTFRVFTASMYHRLSPDVYIEASNPNIVKVKKAGVTWNDFFQTLPFSLTKNCLTTGTKETFCTNQNKTLKFYVNGVKTNKLLDKVINDGDKALVSYGEDSERQIQEQIDKLSKLGN